MTAHRSVLCLFVLVVSTGLAAQTSSGTGVLLLAHGGAAEWNERVLDVASTVDQTRPTEVAFGMASRASIQAGIDRLTSRGVTDIVVVPLFVSSWSSVITSTEYLLGLRPDAPPELALFAKMDHTANSASRTTAHHVGSHPPDLASRVMSAVPVRMTSAFNRHPLIGQVVVDRARSISRSPPAEAVILVAHGPVPDEDNRRWLDDMTVLADQVRQATPFASVEVMTVRDDAGPVLRQAATDELRNLVERQLAARRRVLIVPHLMSFGGIEKGILKRLEGLDYTMTTQALTPDARVAQWVLANLK